MSSTRNRLSEKMPSLTLTATYDAEIDPLLTTIDRIRNRIGDLDTTIDLPSIVVVGEQSSGKSSVLEALSGIPLPRGGQTMTTKCPLELRMRKSPTWHASLECDGKVIRESIGSPNDIGPLITAEQDRLTRNTDQISKKVLLLNVQANWLPNLTLIDLPGIIQVTTTRQEHKLVNMIEELVQDYLERAGTIILAIIPACNDIETSAAIKYARLHDPDGERTIGVLTKLDLVDRGVEQKILDVFNNKRIPLKHGYLMVKCRTQEDIDQKIELGEAQRKEEQFFIRSSKFHVVPTDRRGSAALGQFLSRQLVTRIKQTIPQLLTDLRLKITEVDEECRSIGIDDYKQISTTAEARTRYLTEKLFALMQSFRNEIHHVEEGAQVNNNPFYAKRNEFNQQFYHEMHQCKFDHGNLIREIKTAMIATQGPEPSDYILFRVTKTVCLQYIKAIRKPMEKYLTDMLERTNYVILQVINKVFYLRPNLLLEIRAMHENLERQLKSECHRELELILEMEESFVYADNALYKDTLQRTKKLHKTESSSSTKIIKTTRQVVRTPVSTNASATTVSNKRKNDVLSEDLDDEDIDQEVNPPIKISRPISSTSRFNVFGGFWNSNSKSGTSEVYPTSDRNDNRSFQPNHVSSSLTVAETEINADEETLEYKIRILAMQDIICQRVVLTFPQRVEFQLVRKQFSSIDLQSSILSSRSLEKLDTLMANDPHIERKQNELITKRKLYEDTIKDLQNLEQH